MRHVSITLIMILIAGCGTVPIKKINIKNIFDSASLEIIDLRPESEKTSKIFSLSITSKAYAIYRNGNDTIDPSAIRIFQHRIYEKYSDNGVMPEVKVHHFVVYMNFKSELRRVSLGTTLGGFVGAAVASGVQNRKVDGIASLVDSEVFNQIKKEYIRAIYNKEENPNKASIYVVYIDAEIDGKRRFIKTMTPRYLPDGKNPHSAAIETASAYFLELYD